MAADVSKLLEYDADAIQQLVETVYDLCKGIKDPEKFCTLEDLEIICEEDIVIHPLPSKLIEIQVTFTPTLPNCHLASVIGLCLMFKLKECLPKHCKINVRVKEGSHVTDKEISKQIQDKERTAAAMENHKLKDLVQRCLKDS